MEVDRARLFPLHVLADEGKRVLGHPLHLVECGEDPGLGRHVLDELGMQPQTRDRGAQVVRDRRQHGRSTAHIAVEACAHEIERAHRLAGLDRPGLGQVLHRLAAAELPGGVRETAHGPREPSSHDDRHGRDAQRREQEDGQERRTPGRRAGRRTHRDVQPAPVLQRHRRGEPVGLPLVRIVIVVLPVVIVIFIVVVIVVTIVIVIIVIVVIVPIAVVQEARPERRHPDPFRAHAERGGEIAGDGGRSLAGAQLAHYGLTGQREPREVRARRRDDGVVQLGRRIAHQPRHRGGAQDRIIAVRIAQRLHPLPCKERDGDALGCGEREQQQQRELPGEAPGREPHPRSTPPANR